MPPPRTSEGAQPGPPARSSYSPLGAPVWQHTRRRVAIVSVVLLLAAAAAVALTSQDRRVKVGLRGEQLLFDSRTAGPADYPQYPDAGVPWTGDPAYAAGAVDASAASSPYAAAGAAVGAGTASGVGSGASSAGVYSNAGAAGMADGSVPASGAGGASPSGAAGPYADAAAPAANLDAAEDQQGGQAATAAAAYGTSAGQQADEQQLRLPSAPGPAPVVVDVPPAPPPEDGPATEVVLGSPPKSGGGKAKDAGRAGRNSSEAGDHDGKDHKAKPRSNTTTPLPPLSSVRLYCWALMMPHGYERGLVTAQLNKRVGPFECDDFEIFSEGDLELSAGPPRIGTTDIGSVKCDYGGPWYLALNSKVFIKVWRKIFEVKTYQKNDWTIKLDPDAVFIADRMRKQVRRADPNAVVYLNNCDQGLHGPLEVISVGGMRVYGEGIGSCEQKLSYEFNKWGEDVFLRHCLGLLKVNRVDNFRLLSEDRCFYENPAQNGCTSGKVSFHPFKNPDTYFRCLDQAKR